MRRLTVPLVAAALLAMAPGTSRGDVGPPSEWYLMPGVDLGFTIEEASAHGLLGAEVSAARLFRKGAWYGAYADGLRDFRQNTTRFSLGGEIGYTLAGADVGIGYETGDEENVGVRVRGCLTGGWVGVCGGSFIRLGDAEERATGEVTLLIKIPIPLQGNRLRPVR